MENIERFEIKRLIIFSSDNAVANEEAKRDHHQCNVVAIQKHTGDSEFRNSMKYQIEYFNGNNKWQRISLRQSSTLIIM